MKPIRHITSLLLVAALFAGCRKDDRTPAVTDGRILFSADILDVNVGTRASVVTSSSLDASGIYVSATRGSAGSETSLWTSTAFTKTGSYFDGGRYWDESNPGYHFYSANTPLTFSAAGTTVSASNTTDVVCEYLASPTFKGVNTLSFDHIFARIGNVTVSAADGYTITNVHMSITPYTGGTYNLRTGSGQSDGTGWSALVSGSATELANTTPSTKSNDLYLVPGTYDISVTWTATKGAYTIDAEKTFSDVVVEGGKVNAVTVSLKGDASSVELGVTVTPWTGNAVAMGDVTPEEETVYSFGGLEIAPGSLYWNGSAWSIDEAWDSHNTYETAYGVNSGVASTYFSYLDMGALFESAGFSKNDGDIENLLDPLDGWRLPTLSELEMLFTDDMSVRSGSSVWTDYMVDYYPAHWLPVCISGTEGVIIFPDGETFDEGYGLSCENFDDPGLYYDMSSTELDMLLDNGCVFLPTGNYHSSWAPYVGGCWSSTQDYKHESHVFWFEPSGSCCEFTTSEKDVYYYPVRLVRPIE